MDLSMLDNDKTSLNPKRLLAGKGEQCKSLFDCSGSLICCKGLLQGADWTKGLCYAECNLRRGDSCSDDRRCSFNLKCCNGSCINSSERCGTP